MRHDGRARVARWLGNGRAALLGGEDPHELVARVTGTARPAPGDLVKVDPGADGVHLVREVLAPADSGLADMYLIAADAGLQPYFTRAVMAEAGAMVANPGIDDPSLDDQRGVPYVTIDYAQSRDLDQAVHVAARPGGYVVRYALADASYYVRPGSLLMAEAVARGASFYLPGLTVPMLPISLCEGIISLNEGVDRRALVMEMELDPRGVCTATHVRRARIHSRHKLTYQGVQDLYDHPETHPLRDTDVAASLLLLREVGELRLADARARDVVQYNRVEVDLGYADARGMQLTASVDQRLPVERYNEQVSLLCNVEGALILARGRGQPDAQPVFRVHPAPPPERLEELAALIDALVEEHDLDRARWAWRGEGALPRTLADYLEQLPRDLESMGVRVAVERQALLTNVRSSFAGQPAPHHGVGASAYARISAPMREVVGIFTHKELLETVGLAPSTPPGEDERLRSAVIEAGNRAHDVQRAVTKQASRRALDQIFGRELSAPKDARRMHPATIVGMRRSRAYALLDDPPVEVKLYADDLTRSGRGLELLPGSVALLSRRGIRYAVGERVVLRVSAFDPLRGRYGFDVLKRSGDGEDQFI